MAGPAGSVPLTVSFAGTEGYHPSSASVSYAVLAEDSTLVVSAPTSVLLTARLTETDTSAGLGSRTVRFLVNGVAVGTATTDGDGRASVLLKKKLKAGDVVEAAFGGDGTYAPSRSRA